MGAGCKRYETCLGNVELTLVPLVGGWSDDSSPYDRRGATMPVRPPSLGPVGPRIHPHDFDLHRNVELTLDPRTWRNGPTAWRPVTAP